ncbi:MAG: NAD(P)/FAD-dependent oxidoreductase [Verrucomicrobia bacterium]|nr:NAD(P)/FAD-dependent oxidoreductase [Verrucomicrobiota bacterium]
MKKNFDNGYDAVVVGSGPNGLACAITLQQAGLSTVLFEAKQTVGGGMRSAELTLPGFIHDICSAVYPFGIGSPFFSLLPLFQHGLEWIHPDALLAHPFEDGRVSFLEQSIDATANTLGGDAFSYIKICKPLAANWKYIVEDILAPLHFPKYFWALLSFAVNAVRSSEGFVNKYFKHEIAKSFFSGIAAHSMLPLDASLTAAFALVLALSGHVFGWPIVKGGSQKFADALLSYYRALGGHIVLNTPIKTLDELPKSRAIFFDVSTKCLLDIVQDRFPDCYTRKLKKFRYGPGVFKIDWALSSPIPWKAKDVFRAATVHVGGMHDEITLSEKLVSNGKHPEKPFVLLVQPSLFDKTRAPAGKETAWAYCHVPNGSCLDMTESIERQVERFAPGFTDCILARSIKNAQDMERENPNYVGGDINGGASNLIQQFFRPVSCIKPYRTPLKNVYLCSASTPPGGGVHGMCGVNAAKLFLSSIIS